ncbi:MAG: hypothetical protein K2M82_05190 [Lachnospiraceae bacterium]|nr:hypothetical protein [Lachnospiraceae bacterium]
MSYLKSDIKKLYKSKLVKYFLIIGTAVMVLSAVFSYVESIRYSRGMSCMGMQPYMYWILMPASGIGNTVYFAVFWVLPVVATGLVFFDEQNSSMLSYLTVRGKRYKYYWSKAISLFIVAFVNIFGMFLINIFLTNILFDSSSPRTEQFSYIIPGERTFAYPLFEKNPIYVMLLYAFLNSLAIALMSLAVFAVHAIIKLKNRYIALVVPAVLIYLAQYLSEWMHRDNLNMNLGIIIQPMGVSALLNPITTDNVLLAYGTLAYIVAILLFAGFLREREIM